MISIDDFSKLDIRIGVIRSAEKLEGADKLLKLSVDVGEESPRQILAGIALYVGDPATLVGMRCPFVVNLEPRVLRGEESQGMMLAASAGENGIAFLNPSLPVEPGTIVR